MLDSDREDGNGQPVRLPMVKAKSKESIVRDGQFQGDSHGPTPRKKRIGRPRKVATERFPQRMESGHWVGLFGEAILTEQAAPPGPEPSQREHMFWLFDNVLKAGGRLDIGRTYDSIRSDVRRYRRERGLARSEVVVRPAERGEGWSSIWRIAK